MRKILVGIVSVAGLLAVALALSTSPATAATKVVKVFTDTNAGDYTVSWETQGGCDPGSGTSGATGSKTLTVAATNKVADPNAPKLGELAGNVVEDAVTTNDDCTYKWKGSFTDKATGDICQVSGLGGATNNKFEPKAGVLTFVFVKDSDKCAASIKFNVNINPVGGWFDNRAKAAVASYVNADGVTVPAVAAVPETKNSRTEGAILAHKFTAQVTPHKDSPTECSSPDPVESEVNANDTGTDLDDKVAITLKVVDKNPDSDGCSYNVTISVPAGFSLDNPESGVIENFTVTKGAKEANNQDATVSIAQRTIYLTQRVTGDAGGGAATYKWTAPCSLADLPPPLAQLESTPTAVSGIYNTGSVLAVELREGHYNITAGLTTEPQPIGTVQATSEGVTSGALDKKGVACSAVAELKTLPDGCTAVPDHAGSDLTDYVKIKDKVILTVSIVCAPPAPPVDTGGDMDGGDMTTDDGDVGDGGDLMSPDPGDVPPADDPDDGPDEDTPTG